MQADYDNAADTIQIELEQIDRLGGIGETPARVRRRRTRRGAASSVGQIALLFGLPASLPRLVRRSPARAPGFRQSLLDRDDSAVPGLLVGFSGGRPVLIDLIGTGGGVEDRLEEAGKRYGLDGEALIVAARAALTAPNRAITLDVALRGLP